MTSIPHARWWEIWAPVAARIIFAGTFLMGAMFKIPGTPGFSMESGMTASMGIPYATFFVFLAFLLEVIAALAVLVGWHARAAACVLAIFTLALAFIFHFNPSDQMVMMQFVSHLGLVAGLLYVSVYGAKHFAIRKD